MGIYIKHEGRIEAVKPATATEWDAGSGPCAVYAKKDGVVRPIWRDDSRPVGFYIHPCRSNEYAYLAVPKFNKERGTFCAYSLKRDEVYGGFVRTGSNVPPNFRFPFYHGGDNRGEYSAPDWIKSVPSGIAWQDSSNFSCAVCYDAWQDKLAVMKRLAGRRGSALTVAMALLETTDGLNYERFAYTYMFESLEYAWGRGDLRSAGPTVTHNENQYLISKWRQYRTVGGTTSPTKNFVVVICLKDVNGRLDVRFALDRADIDTKDIGYNHKLQSFYVTYIEDGIDKMQLLREIVATPVSYFTASGDIYTIPNAAAMTYVKGADAFVSPRCEAATKTFSLWTAPDGLRWTKIFEYENYHEVEDDYGCRPYPYCGWEPRFNCYLILVGGRAYCVSPHGRRLFDVPVYNDGFGFGERCDISLSYFDADLQGHVISAGAGRHGFQVHGDPFFNRTEIGTWCYQPRDD